jgi:CBS domain-containing protein
LCSCPGASTDRHGNRTPRSGVQPSGNEDAPSRVLLGRWLLSVIEDVRLRTSGGFNSGPNLPWSDAREGFHSRPWLAFCTVWPVAAIEAAVEAPLDKITASQVMTREVLTVGPDWSIDRLVEFLSNHAISGAPVVSEENVPMGVVSLTDVARNGALAERRPAEVHTYYGPGLEKTLGREDFAAFRVDVESQTTVREIMTPVVFSVDDESTVREVANAMITGRIHRVIVTRAQKMVGIISSMDLLPLVRDM